MAGILTIKLNKSAGATWGFRLQGGKDFATPLCIQKVNVGSVAAQAGLQAGDAIVSIGNKDALSLRHKEAQDAIVNAGLNFEMVVQRGSQIWRPTVTALPERQILPDGVPVATKTSLAANPKIVNAQYNSPVNIYSEDSIAETLSAQAEVIGKGGVLGINFKKYAKEEKIRTDSPTYKLLHGEMEDEPRRPRPASQNFHDSVAFQRDVTHEQKGYYNINEKLYCDVHAQQAARTNPPAPNFEPVIVQPGSAPPPGAFTAPQASRMKIPTAFQQGGAAPAPAPAPAPVPAPQPEVIQPVLQEVPQPLPEPVFEPTQVPLAVPAVSSPPPSQTVEEEEGVQSPPLLNGGTTEEEALLPPQDRSDHVTEERQLAETDSKPIENGFVEDSEKVASDQQSEPVAKEQPKDAVENGETQQISSVDVAKEAEPSQNVDAAPKTALEPEPLPETQAPALEPTKPETTQEQSQPETKTEPLKEFVKSEPTPSLESTEPAAPAQPLPKREPLPIFSAEPLYKPPQPPSAFNAFESQSSKALFENSGTLLATDGLSTSSHFQSQESRFSETKFSSSSSSMVVQTNLGNEAVTQRAPAPAPAPIKPFAPAPPAPVPVAAAPMKPAPAPAYSTSANPQGFGAPAGDINIRSHIPKKGQRFEWPPCRTTPVVEEESHPPAWAPAGEIPSVLRPVKPAGPLPKRPPLLPTPPPPKDYDVIVMKSLSSTQMQTVQQQSSQQTVKTIQSSQQSIQKSSQHTIQKTVQQSSQSRSIPATKSISQSFPPAPKILPQQDFSSSAASRFPNPAPALINLTPSVAPINKSYKASSASSSKSTSKKSVSKSPVSNVASKPFSRGGMSITNRPKISPPKVMPVTEPMPSVKFESVAMPKLSDVPKPQLPQPSSISTPAPIPKQQKLQKQETAIAGFKSVNAPLQKSAPKTSGGFKTVKVPELAPTRSFVTSSLPASAPALSEIVVPKPVPSNPPVPAGDVPAPIFAPAPAPIFAPAPAPIFAPAPAPIFAPAPISAPVPVPIPASNQSFGTNTMPKPVPPPGMGGKIGPGGPPAKGVLQVAGNRTTPRRGRGVMNQATSSRIPVCNACQRQIRGPFVSALGKTWCPDHFICATSTCKRNIIDMGFVEEQGLLYCEVCYESYLAPICGKCDKRIKGDCLNAVGKQFHPECFCCAYCGKVFGSGAFYLEDGLPYCETDWNDLFTTKCVGCNFPIEAGDRWVEALNNNYHSQCFKCSKCHKNLEGQSFFAKGGKPFCKAHAQRGF